MEAMCWCGWPGSIHAHVLFCFFITIATAFSEELLGVSWSCLKICWQCWKQFSILLILLTLQRHNNFYKCLGCQDPDQHLPNRPINVGTMLVVFIPFSNSLFPILICPFEITKAVEHAVSFENLKLESLRQLSFPEKQESEMILCLFDCIFLP